MEYNFRPVVFVNILGVNDKSKLVLFDGKVLNKTETGFQLCDIEVLEANTSCLAVVMSENTVVQDDLIKLIPANSVVDGRIVTVLGKANSENIAALHIVIDAANKEASNLALFTGDATSDFNVDHFTMDADNGDDVMLQPLSALTVALVEGSGVRVFNKYGDVVTGAESIFVGTDIDAFGLVEHGVTIAEKAKAAFVIIDNQGKDDKISGVIAAINQAESQLTVTVVNDTFSGDVCVDATDSIIFILAIVDGKAVSKEISMMNLEADMPVDIYGQDDGLACVAADVVLVAEPLELTPVGTAPLVTGN